jgi:hypothetical protein
LIEIEDPVVGPDSDVVALAEAGLTEDVLAWYRKQCDESLYFFVKAVLGFKDLTASLHKPLCDYLQHSMVDRGRGVLMPRKFFKSTCVKGYVLWRLRNNTNLRFLFVGENDAVGKKNLNDIRWHLLNNHLLRALYPGMIPADGSKWSESEILLPRTQTFDEPTITAIGIGAKHTGFHYNEIIYDDPIGLVARDSPAEMQQSIEWFKAAQGLLDSPESLELIVGTRWKSDEGDLFGWIIKELPFSRGPEGPEGYCWYQRSCIENGESIFPERYPLKELEKIRKRMGPALWAANMMNDPATPGSTDFPDEWVQSFTVSEDGKAVVIGSGPTREVISLRNLVRISVYDPSAGGKGASAENAICTAGMDSKRRVFVLDIWSKNCGFGTAIEQWHRMNDKWNCWRNYFEAVGAHKTVEEQVRLRKPGPCDVVRDGKTCGKVHRRLNPKKINPDSKSKEDRIRALAQPAFEEKRVFIRIGMEKLRKQITNFPYMTLVDQFDTVAYAISLLRPPMSEEEIADRPSNTAAMVARPRTHTGVDYGGYR